MTIDRRMEEHRWRDNQAAGTVEDDTAEVARFPDDGGIAGTIEMIVHLFDEARHLVTNHSGSDRVHCEPQVSGCKTRLRLQSTRPCQFGGMTVVASSCSTMAGPSTTAPTASRLRS